MSTAMSKTILAKELGAIHLDLRNYEQSRNFYQESLDGCRFVKCSRVNIVFVNVINLQQ